MKCPIITLAQTNACVNRFAAKNQLCAKCFTLVTVENGIVYANSRLLNSHRTAENEMEIVENNCCNEVNFFKYCKSNQHF